VVLCLILCHVCLSYQGGYEQFRDPALVPRPAPQYYYQNPYETQYNQYPPTNFAPPRGYDYGNRQYDAYPPEDSSFVEEGAEDFQTPAATGTAPAAASTAPAEPSVVTPQETQEPVSSTAASSPTTTSNMDALDIQLAAALEAVKADMISKGKQVLEEQQWTVDVKAVIEQYQHKVSNVYKNIEKLKKDMGDLYRKKQQILNAEIQKSLTAKLKDSKEDLNTVQTALEKVMNTQAEFEQSKKDIQGTIDSIYSQLAELKGQATVSGGAGPGTTGEAAAAGDNSQDSQAPSSQDSQDSSDGADSADEDTDVVDRKADISSKIDAIKSIVDALNT